MLICRFWWQWQWRWTGKCWEGGHEASRSFRQSKEGTFVFWCNLWDRCKHLGIHYYSENCLQEILEELISSTIMNMTCSFGRTLATLDTGNQNDRFVSILQILLQISTINAGIMTANKSMPPSLHHTGYNHCTQQPTCTVMQHTGFQIKIFSFNPKSYGCSFGNTKHPYVA